MADLTALMEAALMDQANKVAQILTQHPRLVNATEKRQGYSFGTPLHKASSYGNLAVTKVLLARGAGLEIRDKYGRTALMLAITEGLSYGRRAVEVVKELVAKGADLDTRSNRGETALMRAVEREHKEVVGFLLESGARMDIRTTDGFTVLINAAANNQTDMLELLLAHGGRQYLDITDSDGCSALWWAVRNGALKTTQMLLRAGANPFLPNDDGITPHQAAQRYSQGKCYAPFKHVERTMHIFKARRVHEDQARAQQLPNGPRPHYYRRDANAPLVALTLVSSNQTSAVKKRTVAAFANEVEKHETLGFVVKGLSDDLFRELLDGLRIMA